MLNIVLFQPEIAVNTGNIIRTAMALNAKVHLIKPLGFSLDEKALKRASMDYIKNADISIYESLEDFTNKNPEADIYYVSRYAHQTYSSCSYEDICHDYYFMFGRESTGIPHDVILANYNKTVRIPMIPNARSLNLSNSVAIVLFEAARQQKFFGLSTIEAIKGEDFIMKEKKL